LSIIERLRNSIPPGWQKYVNVYLFLNVAAYTGWQLWKIKAAGALDFTEISFAVQNLALCGVILLRYDHKAIDGNVRHQVVALGAFFSGLLMLGQPQTSSAAAGAAAFYLTILANLLGLLTIFNLGRSFGILIARREIRTSGLYSFVRHPMYATDLLLRAAYFIGHAGWETALITILSVLLYYLRAVLEERFLSGDADYRAYLQKVRWRFIPHLV
jgi:protein-S-isoprenylcysteine O-methyltransferase Ste14